MKWHLLELGGPCERDWGSSLGGPSSWRLLTRKDDGRLGRGHKFYRHCGLCVQKQGNEVWQAYTFLSPFSCWVARGPGLRVKSLFVMDWIMLPTNSWSPNPQSDHLEIGFVKAVNKVEQGLKSGGLIGKAWCPCEKRETKSYCPFQVHTEKRPCEDTMIKAGLLQARKRN